MLAVHPFPTSTLVPVNGIELEVFEAGRENRRPIVLCHGWPEHAFSWRFQIPALVDAGYHVIVPNQRGYGRSSRPAEVSAYAIDQLAADLTGLLDHYGYETAVFMGHDWGAMVVWGLSLLHPERVSHIVNLALPYQDRGDRPWLEMMEAFLGSDNYFVHFNRRPGEADAILDRNARRFLHNLYRKDLPPWNPARGMQMIALAQASSAEGEPLLTEAELDVFVDAFEETGFTSSIHWYRNLDRNWHLLGAVDPVLHQPTLMLHGDRDPIPPSPTLQTNVPNAEVAHLDCGHWIQQERPEETNRLVVDWLARKAPSKATP